MELYEVRRNPPKLDGTLRNQTEPYEIRRNPPKLDGTIQN